MTRSSPFPSRTSSLSFFCTAIAIIIGCACFKETPIDAFPDVTNTKVTIITQWPGRSAEEVEKFITTPIEIAMNSVQQKSDIRSTTLFGLSVVNVMSTIRQTIFTPANRSITN